MWLATGETDRKGKAEENQKTNLGPFVNHNNRSCEPFIQYLLCVSFALQTFL